MSYSKHHPCSNTSYACKRVIIPLKKTESNVLNGQCNDSLAGIAKKLSSNTPWTLFTSGVPTYSYLKRLHVFSMDICH